MAMAFAGSVDCCCSQRISARSPRASQPARCQKHAICTVLNRGPCLSVSSQSADSEPALVSSDVSSLGPSVRAAFSCLASSCMKTAERDGRVHCGVMLLCDVITANAVATNGAKAVIMPTQRATAQSLCAVPTDKGADKTSRLIC